MRMMVELLLYFKMCCGKIIAKDLIGREQAEVDRYKKEKADRKKTMRKEKIMRNVKRCVAGVIVLAIVGWFGYSAYDLHSSNQERAVAEVNYDSVKDYLSTLSAE